MNKELMISINLIKNKIFTIRNLQVMLDSDLAELYGVDTRVLNQAVKRNKERFPEEFMFQLTEIEYNALRSQFVTTYDKNLKSQTVISRYDWGGRRNLPYTFTEQGVAMLSAVLRSETAVKISIQIINAFVTMRKFIASNAQIFQRLDTVEKKQIEHKTETDEKFNQIFNAIENKEIKPKKGIFFDGQIFDAYKFVSDLVKSAENSIILIDNFVDESVLILFSKRQRNVNVIIHTKNLTEQLKLDLKKYNSQYDLIKIEEFDKAHDRFIIIDNKEVYHLGASLKDLGKKWFAFSKFDKEVFKILDELNLKDKQEKMKGGLLK
ncbi:MAG: ORF6N domain-containing protein [Candidatus Woesearchaeota archaeon]